MAEKKKKTDKDKLILEEKEIRIIWDQGDDLPVQYSNHFYVSHQGGAEFHLTFGHMIPPLTIGMSEQELPEILKIKPVSKLVLSPEAMGVLIDVLQKNLDRLIAKKEDSDD